MRVGLENTLSDVVRKVLGVPIRLSEQGRVQDVRFCFGRRQKSPCIACTVLYLKEHAASDRDYPCERDEQRFCDTFALARALGAFASATAAETKIEAEYRRRGISTEVSIGRGSAHNLSIIVKITEADKARIQGALRTTRHEQKLSSALTQALDVLSPTLDQDSSP